MPNDSRQGTGRHPHKDTKEPWPHTQENRQQQQQQSSGQRRQEGGEQRRQQQQGGGEGRRQQQQQQQQRGGREERESLERREYRDQNGEIHHHTRTYMEQHGKDGGGER